MASFTALASAVSVSGTGQCQVALSSNGTVYPRLKMLDIGASGTPADYKYQFGIYHTTDMGTGGTSCTAVKGTPGASSGANLKIGTWSTTAPAKLGSTNAWFAATVYDRIPRHFEWAGDDRLHPASLTNNIGYGIFSDVAPATQTFTTTIGWDE